MDNATTAAPSELLLPVPVIVVIAIGGYLLLIVILLVIRQCLVARGACLSCAPCGKEDGSLQCCDCWISCAEACNCCAYPNVKTCLDSICGPADNRFSLTKCVSCQACQSDTCCGDESTGCEFGCGPGESCSCSNGGCESCCPCGSPSSDSCCGGPSESCCDCSDMCSCPSCGCAGCDCACQAPECDTIDCLCFKINMHN